MASWTAGNLPRIVTVVPPGGEWEMWLAVHADGRVVAHCENDGDTLMRRGPEHQEREITLADVVQLNRRYACRGRDLVAEVRLALAEATRPLPSLP